MRRPAVALTSLAAIAALAFSPATAEDEGTHLDLTATATGTLVDGTLDFGGALTTGSDDAGDATVPGAGLDVGDLRLAQDGPNFVVELDVLDAAQGEVAPTAGSRYTIAKDARGGCKLVQARSRLYRPRSRRIFQEFFEIYSRPKKKCAGQV